MKLNVFKVWRCIRADSFARYREEVMLRCTILPIWFHIRRLKHPQRSTNRDASARKSSPPTRSNGTERLLPDDQKPFFSRREPSVPTPLTTTVSEEALLGRTATAPQPFKELTRNINAVMSSAAGVIPAIAVFKTARSPRRIVLTAEWKTTKSKLLQAVNRRFGGTEGDPLDSIATSLAAWYKSRTLFLMPWW